MQYCLIVKVHMQLHMQQYTIIKTFEQWRNQR